MQWDDALSEVAPLWLGVLGAITGILGLLTAIASAWYTRRAALAAEGPPYPNIEVNHHAWDQENPGWYRLEIIVRNRTNEPWELVSARAPRLLVSPIMSSHSRPYEGDEWDPKIIPLNDIPADQLQFVAPLGLSVGPLGAKHFHGHGGDVVRASLLLRPSSFSKATNRLWLSLTLEAKTERVRHKDIAITRRLKPRTMMPA